MRIYVINLESSKERRLSISERLRNDDCNYKIFSAVDGRNLPVHHFRSYKALKSLFSFGRLLYGGEVGCFMSHRKCLEAFLRDPCDMCLILEDDVNWPQGTKSKIDDIESLLLKVKSEWHVLNIGTPTKRPEYFTEIGKIRDGQKIGWAADFPMNFHAMIWSKKGAQSFLDHTSYFSKPIDVVARQYYSSNGLGLGVLSSIIDQTKQDSDINDSIRVDARKILVRVMSAWHRYRRGRIRKASLKDAKRTHKDRQRYLSR